jgi:hypothetical protein
MSLSSYFIVVLVMSIVTWCILVIKLVVSIVTWCILVIKRHASINHKTDKILREL